MRTKSEGNGGAMGLAGALLVGFVASAAATPTETKVVTYPVGADLKFKAYEGARHSFTNPDADALAEKLSMPIGYDAEADRASWAELATFLRDLFAVGEEEGGDGA